MVRKADTLNEQKNGDKDRSLGKKNEQKDGDKDRTLGNEMI